MSSLHYLLGMQWMKKKKHIHHRIWLHKWDWNLYITAFLSNSVILSVVYLSALQQSEFCILKVYDERLKYFSSSYTSEPKVTSQDIIWFEWQSPLSTDKACPSIFEVCTYLLVLDPFRILSRFPNIFSKWHDSFLSLVDLKKYFAFVICICTLFYICLIYLILTIGKSREVVLT